MKAVILADGYGTRLSEETSDKPKAMVEIGGLPILWYIMKGFSAFGVKSLSSRQDTVRKSSSIFLMEFTD